MADGEHLGEGTDAAILVAGLLRECLSHALWFLTVTVLRRRRGRKLLLLVGLPAVAVVSLAQILDAPLAAPNVPPRSPWP
jgi:hypothetical protein